MAALLSSNSNGLHCIQSVFTHYYILLRVSLVYTQEFVILKVQLQQIGRLEANRPDKIRSVVEANGIAILHIAPDIMETFYDLPMPDIAGRTHSDPFDRIIIATALRRGYTLVSHDTKFPWYKEHCRLSMFEV